MCVGLGVGIFSTGPVGPVGFIPGDKADIAEGRNAGHLRDSDLETFDADGDHRFGVGGIGLAQLLNDSVHLRA